MPTLLYHLELTDQELFDLWFRLTILESVGRLHGEEQAILDKLSKLMEGQ